MMASERFRVKTTVFLLVIAMSLCGCDRVSRGNTGSVKTETIKPAEAKPAPTGTEALTQTTEVEDSRSEGEGGVSTAATPPPAKTSAPAKKKHK